MIWKACSISLINLKTGQDVDIPVYSHEIYDIVPDKTQRVQAADFVIVEGINVFQTPHNSRTLYYRLL